MEGTGLFCHLGLVIRLSGTRVTAKMVIFFSMRVNMNVFAPNRIDSSLLLQ